MALLLTLASPGRSPPTRPPRGSQSNWGVVHCRAHGFRRWPPAGPEQSGLNLGPRCVGGHSFSIGKSCAT